MSGGTLVYVPDDALAWTPAELVERAEDGSAVVRLHTIEGVPRSAATVTLKPDSPISLQNVGSDGRPEKDPAADLTTLGHLHEASILYNLRKRHGSLQPYT
jgi:myosin heavy subunit